MKLIQRSWSLLMQMPSGFDWICSESQHLQKSQMDPNWVQFGQKCWFSRYLWRKRPIYQYWNWYRQFWYWSLLNQMTYDFDWNYLRCNQPLKKSQMDPHWKQFGLNCRFIKVSKKKGVKSLFFGFLVEIESRIHPIAYLIGFYDNYDLLLYCYINFEQSQTVRWCVES